MWWALDVIAGLYGPAKIHRAFVVTTDPLMLPGMSTRYLISNFPLPGSERAKTAGIRAARVDLPLQPEN
jgi:hypothetical protein